jgi:16S rRNA (cytosine1402-N4)-methyltransferase
MTTTHIPVLLDETLEALAIKADGIYIDATFGRGGHSAAILQRLGAQGRLIAIDRDAAAAECATQLFANEPRFHFVRAGFAELESIATQLAVAGRVAGVLLDLGVSSPQLDEAERGFSFMRDGPLDMRMDQRESMTAAAWLAQASQAAIRDVLRDYGEERFAGRIAGAIVNEREERPMLTTRDLTELIERTVPKREPGKHPATRTFQALRIFLNRELEQLEQALQQAFRLLAPGGRLAVISFHSLEDRMVKRFMRHQATADHLPKRLPVQHVALLAPMRLIGKAIAPDAAELARNPRARSAHLRVAEKTNA